MDYKQPLVYEGLEALIARKFADCIGLAPNYAALYAIPCDSLRSATFTRKYGISASITDEVPYNYFAKAGDAERGVVLMQSEPGVYDKYAVKWLYSVVPGAKTPKKETPTLEKMIRQHAGDPMYFYTLRQYHLGLDPRTRSYDLGNDPVRSFKAYKESVSYSVANYDKWLIKADSNYQNRLLINGTTLMNVMNAFANLIANVAGIYMNERYVGDPGSGHVAVPRELQHPVSAGTHTPRHHLTGYL